MHCAAAASLVRQHSPARRTDLANSIRIMHIYQYQSRAMPRPTKQLMIYQTTPELLSARCLFMGAYHLEAGHWCT